MLRSRGSRPVPEVSKLAKARGQHHDLQQQVLDDS